MKKYLSFIILVLFELFMFYIFPLFCGPTDAIGMVLLILIATFILSFICGFLKNRVKYSFPILISILFIPSIYIYYNESAWIHTIWYFVVSLIGLSFSLLVNYLIDKKSNKNN